MSPIECFWWWHFFFYLISLDLSSVHGMKHYCFLLIPCSMIWRSCCMNGFNPWQLVHICSLMRYWSPHWWSMSSSRWILQPHLCWSQPLFPIEWYSLWYSMLTISHHDHSGLYFYKPITVYDLFLNHSLNTVRFYCFYFMCSNIWIYLFIVFLVKTDFPSIACLLQ